MATAKSIIAQIDSLSKKELAALESEWGKMGTVKRRWATFVGGVIVGVGMGIAFMLLVGCETRPRPPMTGNLAVCPQTSATFCAPGPKVVE